MAMDLNKWVNYAKARLESAVGRGNDELTRLEAEREAELADKPWLRSDGAAPTLDEARARIEWESRRQEELAAERDRMNAATAAPEPSGTNPAEPPAGVPAPSAPAAPADPEELRLAAEAEQAKLAIEERDRAAAQRLDEIRRELGVDAPPDDADR
jgi:multidrug efflux pump subunit AcrA (membrane-fusion protein)